jgi:hypothetical protein
LKESTPVYLLGRKGGNPDSENYLIHGSFNTEQNCTGAFHVLSPLTEIFTFWKDADPEKS